MRKLDLALIVLVVFLGMWCLGMQRGLFLRQEPDNTEAALATENHIAKLEGLIMSLQNEQQLTNEALDHLNDSLAYLQSIAEKRKLAEKKSPDKGGTASSPKKSEPSTDKGVTRQHKEGGKEVGKKAEEAVGSRNKQIGEWVEKTGYALNLTPEEAKILKSIIEERNKKVRESITVKTYGNRRGLSIPGGDVFKKINEEMFNDVKGFLGNDVAESFKDYYKDNPPPGTSLPIRPRSEDKGSQK